MKLPLLKVQHLCKHFHLKNTLLHAVHDLNFSLSTGEIMGIGGESGCGKTTLAKLLLGCIEPSSGAIELEGENLASLVKKKSQAWRRHLQMVFQHPASSLNPRQTVEEILSEPFIIHQVGNKQERKDAVLKLLAQVGLSEELNKILPHALSGGQKQRIAIARAIALKPKLLICDEPFSALDISIQAQIITLLAQLQKENNFTCIVISHDLSLLRYFTDRLAILYLGQLVEYGPSEDVYNHPLHPYTQTLISAILPINPNQEAPHNTIAIKGEVPNAIHSLEGCPFRSRCPHAKKICQTVRPAWKEVKTGHFAACHLF